MKKKFAIVFATVLFSMVIILQIYQDKAFAESSQPSHPKPLPSFGRKMLLMADMVTGKAPAGTTEVIKISKYVPRIPKLKPAAGLSREVIGYYTEDWVGDMDSQRSVSSHGDMMSGVATFSFQLKADGNLAGSSPASIVSRFRNSGGKALALVHNCSNGAFDRDLIDNVLNSPALRAKTVSNILTVVKDNGYNGVNIDFENIPPADRDLFTRFISEVSSALQKIGYITTISIPAKTYDELTGWNGAFDYKELGVIADRIMLMTYDEHWFGGPPGPVASAGWVEQVISYAGSQIPANKLLLGIGMYGYDWEVNSGKAFTLPAGKTLGQAKRFGAVVNWDDTAQVPYFYYWANGIKHVVWFESNNSAAFKLDMVNRYNLAGVAIWRLGFEDDGFWQTIAGKFSNSK